MSKAVMQQALEALEGLADYRYTDRVKNTMASLRQALAEPEQEPVAWRFEARQIDSAWMVGVSFKPPGIEGAYLRNITPLYTAPTPRKPLTDEALHQVIRAGNYDSMEQFARAIERAHGIGEQT